MANWVSGYTNDAYTLMTNIVSQATGSTAIAVTDTTSFVSAGELALRTGTDNVMNAISTVVCRTIESVRPYRRKFDILETTPERWGGQIRKIVPLYMGYEASTDSNTLQATTTLADGNSVDMYTINAPKALQLNFYGSQKLQKSITRFRDQLDMAFHDEEEFLRFIDAIMTEYSNEIELMLENRARLVVNNFIAGNIDMGGANVIDLVAGFNAKYNYSPAKTRDECLSTYVEPFMKYVASQIKLYSSRLEDMTTLYHANLTGYQPIMRHTPKARQKMLMYNPVFLEAEAEVYSGLFNPQYLEIGDFEGVNFWQNPNDPAKISCLPNELDVATGAAVDAAATVTEDFVLGILFDEEALGILPQFDYASTTPFNSKGGYWNMFSHWKFNTYNDYTENSIIFVLGA